MIINILPDTYKEEVRDMYKNHRIVAALSALACVAFIGAVALVPPYVLLKAKKESANIELSAVREGNIKRLGDDAETIIKTVNSQSAFLLTKDTPLFADGGFLERILSYNARGVFFTGIFYDGREKVKNGNDFLSYRIRGIASNRASLSSFIETLRRDPFFEKVDLPISQFVREQDVNFSITLTSIAPK